MASGHPAGPGASPGLLRRRYSVPETVMRKYKLAQQKSDSDESEAGSAPSPRGQSPVRCSGRSRERGPRSALLRRLWARGGPPLGGSHADLSHRSGSSSPRSPERSCEACRRLSDKNLSKPLEHAPSTFRTYINHPSRSPKRQKLNSTASSGQSPERYITQLENARSELLRQTSPGHRIGASSSTSERSFYKNASTSEGSPKLGLSSLATSSYPTTDGNHTSELSSNMTRSSASYSSDDVSPAQIQTPQNRPVTAEDASKNDLLPDDSTALAKKRRQSVCIYMNSLDSPIAEVRSSSTTEASVPLSGGSIDNRSSMTSESIEKTSTDIYTSPQDTASSTEKTTTTESLYSTKTLTDQNETTSPSDSAMSTHTAKTTDLSKTPEIETTDASSSREGKNEEHENRQGNNNYDAAELSDTGISETLDYDTNKNSFNSDEMDHNVSQLGSVTYSEDYSTDVNSDVITCIENMKNNTVVFANLKPYDFECLEVVVSETLNSSAFTKDHKIEAEIKEVIKNSDDKVESEKMQIINKDKNHRMHCSKIDIDQYVSNILIDSLNSMTDQINEINSNVDDDLKLNILEKEIKVKLQSASASPMSLTSNPTISSLLSNFPDKELLETTIIEEKITSLAYSTESTLFPINNITETHEPRANISEEEFFINSDINVEEELSPDTVSGSQIFDESYEKDNSSPDQETLNNNVESLLYINEQTDDSEKMKEYYLTKINVPSSDLNENQDHSSSNDNAASEAVLQQLHKIFENNSQSTLQPPHCTDVDSNFNYCVDNQQQSAYFCGSVFRNLSHLEMSTDVDVFVDNSLNRMMNSIDIDYNATDLCEDIEKLSINKNMLNSTNGADSKESLEKSFDNSRRDATVKQDNESKTANQKVLSNVGTGSIYRKPLQQPLLVPRYSAIPHSVSMEVNTSSDDDISDCESDCGSLIDSLDDPTSPRQPIDNRQKIQKRISHDNKLARGDIMLLLPENSIKPSDTTPTKEKSESFFVPIKEELGDCIKESLVVAEHMPEKIKEKLFKREQKRELRKEHYRRKKMKQLKKELEKQKLNEAKRLKEDHEKECMDILSQLVDQVTDKHNKEDKRKMDRDTKAALHQSKHADVEKKGSLGRKPLHKSDRSTKKGDGLKDFESFVVDKQGNIQMTNSRKINESSSKPSTDSRYEKIENSKNTPLKTNEYPTLNKTLRIKSNSEYKDGKVDPNLVGPRRLYQKTEFKEGNKHVEILEIVECIDSSPEPPSDESQDSFGDLKRTKRSKIPIPIHEKLEKVSKSKGLQKSFKSCRSPRNKNVPMNVSVAKGEQKSKTPNSKIDLLIANILIDAFNEDNPENRNIQLVSSPRDRKTTEGTAKKLTTSTQIPPRRASIPQQNHEKIGLPKYTQKFEVIPEERSSVSVESSNEDANGSSVNRRASLPAEVKLNSAKVSNSPPNLNIAENNTAHQPKNISKSPENDKKNSKENLKSCLKTIDENVWNEKKLNGQSQKSSSVSPKKVVIQDVATSPIPQYISAATSPMPQSPLINDDKQKLIKGKNALKTREGWAGFCRPQTSYSPENEGSHPSSNNPSDREAFEKMGESDMDSKAIAPHPHKILRTVDSRNNIKQISITHDTRPNISKSKDEKPYDGHKVRSSYIREERDVDNEKYDRYSKKNQFKNEIKRTISSERIVQTNSTSMSGSPPEGQNRNGRADSNQSDTSHTLKHSNRKKIEMEVHKNGSRENLDGKALRLPSPFRNHRYSQSSDALTSSGSDSEVGVSCPVLMPRLIPTTVTRHKRTFNRRYQRQEEQFKLPYQNAAGGWSVTLAGSCYTALPSDVEMKVSFPKSSQQQTNSQSDSGLGEEHNYKKQMSGSTAMCKKCGNRESICQNCKVSQSCSCITSAINQQAIEHENQSFLPPAQIRKSSHNSKIESSEYMEQTAKSTKKYFQYLPDVNTLQIPKSKMKKSSVKMARRFSLHCWLPEDKLPGAPKLAKMEVTETILPENEDELSVMGCAILPETKPRVPTMSERDLTRIQTAQFYLRNRQF